MARSVPFKLITPTSVAFEGEASLVIATGTEGEIGILASHAPLLTSLKPGVLRADVESENRTTRMLIATGAGFLQALPGAITVIVDAALTREAINVDATKAELQEAQNRQRDAAGDRTAYAREQEIIDFAQAKLTVAA